MVLKRPYEAEQVAEDSSSKRVIRNKRSEEPNSVEDGIGKGVAVSGDLTKSVQGASVPETGKPIPRRPVLWVRGSYTQPQVSIRIGSDHQVDVPSWEEQQRRNALSQPDAESESEYERLMMGTSVSPAPN